MIRVTKSKGRLGPKKPQREYEKTHRVKLKEEGFKRLTGYFPGEIHDKLDWLKKRFFRAQDKSTRTAIVLRSITEFYDRHCTTTTAPPEKWGAEDASAELREKLKLEGKKHVHGH